MVKLWNLQNHKAIKDKKIMRTFKRLKEANRINIDFQRGKARVLSKGRKEGGKEKKPLSS